VNTQVLFLEGVTNLVNEEQKMCQKQPIGQDVFTVLKAALERRQGLIIVLQSIHVMRISLTD
jgi:hypothetical protein